MDSTSLTTASVAEISRLRADKALGEFIGGPEEPNFWRSQGRLLGVEYGVLGSRRMDCIAARVAASDREIASQRWTLDV